MFEVGDIVRFKGFNQANSLDQCLTIGFKYRVVNFAILPTIHIVKVRCDGGEFLWFSENLFELIETVNQHRVKKLERIRE